MQKSDPILDPELYKVQAENANQNNVLQPEQQDAAKA